MTQAASLSAVRRAVCAIAAGPSRATGWLVSPKGLFATSHTAVGYHVDADIENEAGERRPGRVVWADVARDLAFVLAESGLPRSAEPMIPLTLREVPAARPGDRVFSVAALPGRGLRIAPGAVCAVAKGVGSFELIDTDLPNVGPAGGPLVDADGRAVGLLVRGAPIAGHGLAARRALALPLGEVRAALRSLEIAPDLPRRSPIYRCPSCTSPFVPEHDACLACGALLPHPFPPSAAHPLAERIVRDALAGAGIVANRARTGPRTWHLTARPGPGLDPVVMAMTLDETATAVAIRAPVAVAPKVVREPFYRLLLTLNDQATGPFRLALAGDRVLLVLALPPAMLQGRDLGPMLSAMAETTDHYRKILLEGFETPPLLTLDEPPEW